MQRFDPSAMPGAHVYQLMIGAIVPRPIAFVSSIDEHGVYNLAPFSYFTGCSSNPPVICFCASVRTEPLPATKDTYRNIVATGEFVVNIVSEEFAGQMNACAAQVAPDVDEFTLSGLTPVASEMVCPPRVAESHIQMECRLRQIVTVSEKPNGGYLILGDVVLIHVDDAVLDGDRIDPDKLNAIGRMGGPTYVRTRDRFDLARPK